ncbi:MAG: DUF4911 domain-containing protein [Veillonella sp.]|nr:DUF4911 domain-containing protein [Veillonella sp.]
MAESSHYEGTGQESYLHFYIDKKDVNFINRILEGYEYVGVMTSVDNEGHQMIRCTPDTRDLAIEILKSLGDKILRIDAMA